jgi:DNA polymerase
LLERKVGITKVRGQAFYLKDFVLFPLLHPAAALHQGNMLEPLREDFKKLREFLDRQTKPAESTASVSPTPSTLQIDPPQPAQMELFG